MDFLRAQFARIAKQLSGLTASQKMLAFALLALTGMMLAMWARYAGEPVYEPLLDQAFSQTDISQITSRLAAKGIGYQLASDRILVPTDRKIEVLADLGFAHLLPQNTNAGFDEIVKQMTPWDPADKTARLWNEAKQRELAQVLDSFPNVQEAVVMIDPHDERSFDGHDITPSAMVNLARLDHEATGVRQLATAAADLVAGAEAGLGRGRVTVVVDGITVPIPDAGDDIGAGGDEIIDQIRAAQEMYRDQILQQLSFIKGLMVSVRVDLNTKSTDTQETIVDPKSVAHMTASDEEKSIETYPPPAGGGEAGAGPNLANAPLSVSGGASGTPNTETDSTVTYQNQVSQTLKHTIQRPGDAPPASASVRVPRSYFIEMYKDINKGAEPDDTALATLMTKELANIRDDVKQCTGITSDDAVAVNWYSDGAGVTAALESAPAANSTAAASLRMLSSYGKEMGVGVLAAVSLLMVTMMVRKSAPPIVAQVAAGAAGASGPVRLNADSDVAGEVGEGGKMLDGMELDDEMVKGQQVVEQVSTMVKDDPESAASLVKRWLSKA
jgi:flagellar M-ring protein FliF